MSGSRPSAGQASALMALICPKKVGHILREFVFKRPPKGFCLKEKTTHTPGRAYKLERYVNFLDKRDA